MRVLKTMNTVGDSRRSTRVGSSMTECAQFQRRGAKTLEMVNEINIRFHR